MDPFSLMLGGLTVLVLAGLALVIQSWLVRHNRGIQAHSKVRSGAPSPPSAVKYQRPAILQRPSKPPLAVSTKSSGPAMPISVAMIYTKADGTTRERQLTIYGRNIRDGSTHSLNCREPVDRTTKKFLLKGISRLEIPDHFQPLVLTTPEAIKNWLEKWIPEHSGHPVFAQPRLKDSEISEPNSRPSVPPLPPPPVPLVPAQATPLSLAALLPEGARGFAVFDLETTGRNTSQCMIVEVGLVCVDISGRITEVWETLVNPGCGIPAYATEIHKIQDQDVCGAPSFAQLAALLAAKLDRHVLVAHNLNFDLPILERHFREHSEVQIDLGKGFCTLKGFKGNPANNFKKKLSDLCSFYEIVFDNNSAHTAIGDVLPLAKALIKGLPYLNPPATVVTVRSCLNLQVPVRPWTRKIVSSNTGTSWVTTNFKLEPGMIFATTGEKSQQVDTPIRRAQAHAETFGLKYIKVNKFAKNSPPDFLLSTGLKLVNTKMREARERRIPIVLSHNINTLKNLETPIEAWLDNISNTKSS